MQISLITSVKSRISNLPVIKEKITPPAIQRARSVSEIKTAMFIIFAVMLLFSLFLARVSSRVILFIKPSISYSTRTRSPCSRLKSAEKTPLNLIPSSSKLAPINSSRLIVRKFRALTLPVLVNFFKFAPNFRRFLRLQNIRSLTSLARFLPLLSRYKARLGRFADRF